MIRSAVMRLNSDIKLHTKSRMDACDGGFVMLNEKYYRANVMGEAGLNWKPNTRSSDNPRGRSCFLSCVEKNHVTA